MDVHCEQMGTIYEGTPESKRFQKCLRAILPVRHSELQTLHPPMLRYGTVRELACRGRDGRVAEGARLESVFRGNSNVGSNPTLSASHPAKFLILKVNLNN